MEYESIYIGTIGVKHNNSNLETSFSSKTTPDIFELFEIINSVEWSDESLNICIEISSHALDQKRLKGINWFNSSSLMNIKDDHLDYHKDISSYRDAKFSIFKTNSPVKLIHENISDFSRDYEFVNNSDSQLISISNKNNFADIYFKIKQYQLIHLNFIFLLTILLTPKNMRKEKNIISNVIFFQNLISLILFLQFVQSGLIIFLSIL